MTKKNIIIIGLVIFVIVGLVLILNISRRPKALIAFVIDDWGYNLNNIDIITQIERPITLSILPNLRYSDDIATVVREKSKRHDIILHLPLESKSNIAVEANTIRCNMDKFNIISILERDIESLSDIIGVSNHQGSKATEDERVMGVIFAELKKRKLFFLDSLTTSDSVCPRVAKDSGIRFIQRDVFLDLTDQTDLEDFESYIRKQIRELANVALKKGTAVGIGHNNRTTLEVIKSSIPELEKEGIRIVPLKKLVR